MAIICRICQEKGIENPEVDVSTKIIPKDKIEKFTMMGEGLKRHLELHHSNYIANYLGPTIVSFNGFVIMNEFDFSNEWEEAKKEVEEMRGKLIERLMKHAPEEKIMANILCEECDSEFEVECDEESDFIEDVECPSCGHVGDYDLEDDDEDDNEEEDDEETDEDNEEDKEEDSEEEEDEEEEGDVIDTKAEEVK